MKAVKSDKQDRTNKFGGVAKKKLKKHTEAEACTFTGREIS